MHETDSTRRSYETIGAVAVPLFFFWEHGKGYGGASRRNCSAVRCWQPHIHPLLRIFKPIIGAMSAVITAIVTSRTSFDDRESDIHKAYLQQKNKHPVIHDVDLAHTRPVILKLMRVVLFYLFASLFYAYVENWNVTDCIYFLTVTISTVGYGDFSPTTDGSRMFTILVIVVGLVFIFSILSDMANFVLDLAEEQAAKIAKQKDITTFDPWKYWKKRSYSLMMVLFLLFVGSICLWQIEGWTYIQALYFCVVTVTTIGYGDMAVDKDAAKIFLLFYIPLAVCIVAGALSSIAAIEVERRADEKKMENLNRKLDFNMIREMDTNGDGVDRLEFLVAMLVQNGICDKEEDIDPWLKRFDELDVDGSGMLDQEDIAIMEKQEAERLERLQQQLSGHVPNRRTAGSDPGTEIPNAAPQQNPLNQA